MDLITSKQAAELLHRSTGTLRNWRSQGKGPSPIRLSDKPNGAVLYVRSEVIAFIEAHREDLN